MSEEISGMVIGNMVNRYMCDDPNGFFAGARLNNGALWKRCYRSIMHRVRNYAIAYTLPGRKPRYYRTRVVRMIETAYDEFTEAERAAER